MKKTAFFIGLVLSSLSSFSQGWIGSSGNVIYPVTSGLTLSPISIGIGTSLPLAQFHTTGTVRFAGIANDNTLSKILVQNTSGDLFWRDAATLGSANAWLLNGNTTAGNANASTNFLGTINNVPLIFRSFNSNRQIIYPNGTVRIKSTPFVDLSINDCNQFQDNIGLDLVKAGDNNAGNNFTPSARIEFDGFQGQTDHRGLLHFYTKEASDANLVRRMIINADGNVGIGDPTFTYNNPPTATLHVNCGAPTSNSNIRFENLQSGTGNILVIDANGYVYRGSTPGFDLNENKTLDELRSAEKTIADLKNEIENLKKEFQAIKSRMAGLVSANLSQNYPNPASTSTAFEYYLPEEKEGEIVIADVSGHPIKTIQSIKKGKNIMQLDVSMLSGGTYIYSLVVDGKVASSKKLTVLN